MIVIAAVAVTVAVALGAGSHKEELENELTSEASSVATEAALEAAEISVPLKPNEDAAISTLILTFYNALALGDSEMLTSVCDEISEKG